jgi:hypothetical protein
MMAKDMRDQTTLHYHLLQAIWSPRDSRNSYRVYEIFGSLAEARRAASVAFPNGGYAIQKVATTVMEIKDAADWLAETA